MRILNDFSMIDKMELQHIANELQEPILMRTFLADNRVEVLLE